MCCWFSWCDYWVSIMSFHPRIRRINPWPGAFIHTSLTLWPFAIGLAKQWKCEDVLWFYCTTCPYVHLDSECTCRVHLIYFRRMDKDGHTDHISMYANTIYIYIFMCVYCYIYIYVMKQSFTAGAVGHYHSPSNVVGFHTCLLVHFLSSAWIAASIAPAFQPHKCHWFMDDGWRKWYMNGPLLVFCNKFVINLNQFQHK